MVKKTISFENFDGKKVKKDWYFHLNEIELMDLQLETEGGFQEFVAKAVEENDNKKIVKILKDIIVKSVGIKSEDGMRFIKSEEITDEFCQTGAYPALFLELAQDENAAEAFLTGVFPKVEGATVQPEDHKPKKITKK